MVADDVALILSNRQNRRPFETQVRKRWASRPKTLRPCSREGNNYTLLSLPIQCIMYTVSRSASTDASDVLLRHRLKNAGMLHMKDAHH